MFGFDLEMLLRTVGYLGLFAIVFAETGLLIGFFLPGDSLLFTAGFLASQGHFSIAVVVLGCFVAAVVGDSVGYSIGQRFGPQLFTKPESRYFKPDHLRKSEAFFAEHGGKSVILARFIPIVRTFTPVVAGMSSLRYPAFVVYNVVGALLWAVGVPLSGYFLGQLVPAEQAEKVMIAVVLLILVVSIVPAALKIWKEARRASATS